MKLVRLSYPSDYSEAVHRAIDGTHPIDWSCEIEPDRKRETAQILLESGEGQTLMDALQGIFGGEPDWRLVMLDAEATLPRAEEIPDQQPGKTSAPQALREALFEQVSGDSRLTKDFVVLTVLSAVVAWPRVSFGLDRPDEKVGKDCWYRIGYWLYHRVCVGVDIPGQSGQRRADRANRDPA